MRAGKTAWVRIEFTGGWMSAFPLAVLVFYGWLACCWRSRRTGRYFRKPSATLAAALVTGAHVVATLHLQPVK